MNEVVLNIGGNKIDISDIDVSLTYVVADVANIGKRNKGYSYTIKLLGTKKINNIFANIYDLQQDVQAEFYPYNNFIPSDFTAFNSFKKIPTQLIVSGALIFDGFLELKDIEIKPNETIIYSIILKDEGVKWLSDAENLSLQSLDLGDDCFDINLYNNGQPDNNDTEGKLFCMPLQEYGGLFSNYPSNANIDIENIYPAFFVRELLQQGFNSLGYELIFPLLDKDPYKRLIIPFLNEKWITAVGAVGQEIYKAENITPNFSGLDSLTTIPIFLNFDTVLTDTGNFAQNQVDGTNLFTMNGINVCGEIPIRVKGLIIYEVVNIAQVIGGLVELIIYKNASTTQIHYDAKAYTNGAGTQTFVLSWDFETTITPGDYISISIGLFSLGTHDQAEFYEVGLENSVFLHEWKREHINFNWADLLPDITLLDLVKELTTSFNLYYVNERNTRRIKLLTYDEYYLSPEKQNKDSLVNWNNKLDVGSGKKIENSVGILGAFSEFKYSEGADFFNDEFQEANNNTYTNYKLSTGFELVTKGNTIESNSIATFEYSPLNFYNFLRLPYYIDEPTENLPINDNTDIGLRFLIYEQRQTNSFIFIGYDDYTSSQSTQQYAGAYFANELKWDDLEVGLYITFYSKYINRIIKGRFIEANFYLALTDITNLDFSKLVKIDNQYFILNKVTQYKPNKNVVTKVELLQLK